MVSCCRLYSISSTTILLLSCSVIVTGAFVSPPPRGWIANNHLLHTTALFESSDVVDVEFENVADDNESSSPSKKSPVSSTSRSGRPSKTLLDLSLETADDPELKSMTVPFVDGRSFIDCKLTFMVELDGVNYAIGIPSEHSAAIAISERDGSVIYLSPDDEDNVELMQIMASELQKNLGDDLKLKRTPRVLTISGDLGKYTDGWQDKFFDAVDPETLMDDSDESMDYFHKMMREELGEEEYQKTMDDDDFDIDDDILELFNVPGLGEAKDDVEGINDMINSIFDEDPAKEFDALGKDLEKEWVALRLVGFNFRDGKAYSLVKMLKPFTLVARQVSDDDDEMRFELLTSEEQKLVVPKLEELCQQDLADAGISFQTP